MQDKTEPRFMADSDHQRHLQLGSPSDSSRLQLNQLIGGRYRVISLLGEGGMGAVYKVEQIVLKREQALKTLVGGALAEKGWLRFQKEAKAVSVLDHPSLIKILDFGTIDDSQPYFVMELAEGETLAAIIKQHGTLPIDSVLLIFRQVCQGLAYAHKKGVVHRDIKPSNIMVSNYGNNSEMSVKIVDFGIAKRLDSDNPETIAVTRTGEIFGTPHYMSPEQCRGATVDDRSDVYSVGCVMYEALAGLPPFVCDTALATMLMHQSEKPISLREATMGKTFPDDLERVVAKLLQKEPRNRYGSLDDVVIDLDRIATGEPVLLGLRTNATSKPMVAQKEFKHPLLVVSILLLVLALVVGFAVARLTESHAPQQVKPASVPDVDFDKVETEPTKAPAIAPTKVVPAIRHQKFSSLLPGSIDTRLFDFGDVNLGEIFYLNTQSRVSSYNDRTGQYDKYPAGQPPIMTGRILIDHFQPIGINVSPALVENADYAQLFRAEEICGLEFDECNKNLTDADLQKFKHLKKINVLSIVIPNSLDGKAIDTINEFPDLVNFAVTCDKITEDDVLKLKRLSEFSELRLFDLKGADRLLDKLSASKQLQRLTLNNCAIGSKIKQLASVNQLTSLTLNHNKDIHDDDLRWLSQLKNLKELSLVGCGITANSATVLKTLPITRLYLSEMSSPAQEALQNRMPTYMKVKFIKRHRFNFSKQDADMAGGDIK